MKLRLPPGLNERKFGRALAALAVAVGKEWVLSTDEDRASYVDPYAASDGAAHAPSAAVAPASVEEVQAVLRVANEHKLPLWPISRGKNFGYGGASPRLPGCVVLDLGRMKKILEVNEKLGFCVVEPGVGFYDLHEHLTRHRIAMEVGTPGNGWGSVIGNAVERGFSFRGDHSERICGMEVVLANGEIVRTGMGAMPGNPTWATFKHGFGPSWDQAFVQSNLGVITKMGLWLHPTPEEVVQLRVSLDRPEDLGWYVDTINPLRLRGVVDGNIAITSYMLSVIESSQRRDWYQGRDALPDEVIARIRADRKVGWWNGAIRIAGDPDVNDANLKKVQAALARHTRQEFPVTRALSAVQPARGPSVAPLKVANWYGGRGGHLSFSPVLPADGAQVVAQFLRTRARYIEYGIDYSSTWYNNGRTVANINLILANMEDPDQSGRAGKLFEALVADAAATGYGEYRTHLSYMDKVAATFSYNNHALRRLNEGVKDALDPNGILAPGKNGIWPAAYRNQRDIV
jgi:4-cresol dehydrogenase (hydroxylating) flavoprotein subunit